MISQNVCLVSPLHDAEGRITKLLQLHGKKLINLYNRNAVIGVTPATTSKTADLLRSLGFKIKIQDEKTGLDLGSNYRLALKLGLEWETPDQFKDKIEQEGYSAWLNEFESLPEWQRRLKLIEDSTNVLT